MNVVSAKLKAEYAQNGVMRKTESGLEFCTIRYRDRPLVTTKLTLLLCCKT